MTGGFAMASGWGETTPNGNLADELQFVAVNVITNQVCRSRLSILEAAQIFDSIICTLPPRGVGMCAGEFKINHKPKRSKD